MKLYISAFVSGGNSRGELIGMSRHTEADMRVELMREKKLNRRDYAQLAEFIKSDKLYDVCRCDGISYMLVELNYNGDTYIQHSNTPESILEMLLFDPTEE